MLDRDWDYYCHTVICLPVDRRATCLIGLTDGSFVPDGRDVSNRSETALLRGISFQISLFMHVFRFYLRRQLLIRANYSNFDNKLAVYSSSWLP